MGTFFYNQEKIEELIDKTPMRTDYTNGVLEGYIQVVYDLKGTCDLMKELYEKKECSREAYEIVKDLLRRTIGAILINVEPYIVERTKPDGAEADELTSAVLDMNWQPSVTLLNFYLNHALLYDEIKNDTACGKITNMD